ncbi:MAG TPA: hypothetical protein VK184_23390 [Nostocaceae cyanobacterium]|nr:hypothetical protein [Nostocaceae cyanobacterium]
MMIAELQAIASFMASQPLTVGAAVKEFGTVQEDYYANVIVKPYNPLFQEINIVRRISRDTGKHTDFISSIDFKPVNPPTVETLVQAFGNYKRGMPRIKLPLNIVFRLDLPDKPYKISMIVGVKNNQAVTISMLPQKKSQ